jgi:hypothetical protein
MLNYLQRIKIKVITRNEEKVRKQTGTFNSNNIRINKKERIVFPTPELPKTTKYPWSSILL